jgi:SAM-dependent methyltransferase
MSADRIEPLSADLEQSMSGIAEVVNRQLGTTAPKGDFDPASLKHFSPHLRENFSDEEREQIARKAEELAPWLQGPFLVGGDLVVGGAWRTDSRWEILGPEVPLSLAGKRVLDIGSNAGYDPFSFSLRNPDHVLACEPCAFIEQARVLESFYETGVELRQTGWQWISPERDGRFDLVHCHGVLYHEVDPLGLLERLFEMTVPGGLCLFGSMMHADPEFADLSRMVPLSYFGDDTWWWTPGPVAMRQMLESVGFEVEKSFGFSAGPPGEFPTMNGYFRTHRPATS